MINNIEIEEIIEVVNNYITNNYDYDYADISDDCITYHYTNENREEDCVNVYINLETE